MLNLLLFKRGRIPGLGARHARNAVIEAEHAALETPDQGHVEVPTRHEAFRTEYQLRNLCIGESGTDLVGDPDVGSVPAYLLVSKCDVNASLGWGPR